MLGDAQVRSDWKSAPLTKVSMKYVACTVKCAVDRVVPAQQANVREAVRQFSEQGGHAAGGPGGNRDHGALMLHRGSAQLAAS